MQRVALRASVTVRFAEPMAMSSGDVQKVSLKPCFFVRLAPARMLELFLEA